MSTPNGSRRRGIIWAFVGGAVLIAGVIAILIAALTSQPPTPTPSPDPSATSTNSPSITPSPDVNAFVDERVVERGWVPEPITSDPDTYTRAALAAASTFDPALSSRDEWLAYLATWFTPDTRYTDEADRAQSVVDAQLELRQGVVLPAQDWDSLASQDGRVSAEVMGEIADVAVSNDPDGDMSIGTADVVLTFVLTDGDGGESSSEQSVRVSVQVLCGAGSVPTPDSAQQAGDCKVVRFFTEPLEP